MKNRIALLSLLTLIPFSFASAQGQPAALRSVEQSPALVKLMDVLSEVASGGASLAYFGYSEKEKFGGQKDECKPLKGAEVVKHFETTISDILADSEASVDVATALKDFAVIVGEGEYLECYESSSGNMSYTTKTYFIEKKEGNRKAYRIMFELGYED